MSKAQRDNPMTQHMLGMLGLDPGAGVGKMGAMEDDADLNAELEALLAGEEAPKRVSRPVDSGSKKGPSLTLEQQLASVLKDPTDDDADEFDEEELLNDLSEIMETEGESMTDEETSAIWRPSNRCATNEKSVSESETSEIAPTPAPKVDNKVNMEELTLRRDQYKDAAMKARSGGDMESARHFMDVLKQFDKMIATALEGNPVDLSQMPPPPPSQLSSSRMNDTLQKESQQAPRLKRRSIQEELTTRMLALQRVHSKAVQENNTSKARRLERQVQAYKDGIVAYRAGQSYDYDSLSVPPGFDNFDIKELAAASPASARAQTPKSDASAAAKSQPTSLQEDLQQRMAVLTKSLGKAKEEGNNSKARRLGRQVEAYKDAIKACQANRSYNFAELCVPPGFEPLRSPAPAPAPAPAAVAPAMVAGGGRSTGGPPSANRAAASKLQRQLSRSANQTLVFLQDRQRQFKEAALKAKNQGKKDLALSLLRQAKGFEPMINAAANGLPVDMSKLPALPGEKEVDFEFLKAEDCEVPEDLQSDDPKVLFKQLASKLQAQINLCRANSARCVKMGDVATASKFDRLLKTSQLDLAALRSAESHKDEVPRFHFEWKTLTTERSNPDLGDDTLELRVVRGIDLEVPSGYSTDQLDTYVRAELPFPSSEEAQVFRTDVVRGTNNPAYSAVHKFTVNRKARSFQRVIKNRAIKAEIYYKRGFLKSDKVLGTATVKLAGLENHAELHDSFNLLEGRKAVGGRLEVHLRLREPLAGRQVEEMREKWLCIDAASRPPDAGPAVDPKLPSAATSGSQSIEVMKYERNLLVKELQARKDQLSATAQESLLVKGRELERAIIAQEQALKSGGRAAQKAYAAAIERLGPVYNAEARQALKENNRNKATVLITKKKLCETEAASIRSRL